MKTTESQIKNIVPGSNSCKSEKLLKIVIIASALLIVLFITVVTGFQLTATPKVCSTCHEMTPEYVTWQASSHNKLACIDCHSGTASSNIFTIKVTSLTEGYKHITGKYLLPITPAEPIKDQVCLKCHDMKNRVVTPSGDIIIPHERHMSMNIACVECHSGVTHGKIALRQQTIDGAFERWTAAMGEVQMAPKFRTTAMKQCMECHKEKKVANSCETCHKKIITPPNHRTFAWVNLGVHGQEAIADLDGCDRCHSFTNQLEVIPDLDKVSMYTRTNTFCYECHRQKPYGHDETWRSNHGSKAEGDGRKGCLVCHSSKQSKASDKTVKTYCQKCHKSQHQFWNRATHPLSIGPDTKLTAVCVTCHSTRVCGTCHYVERVRKDANGKQPATSRNQKGSNSQSPQQEG